MSAITEFPLSEEYKKKNFITPADISRLRDWMQTQPHLPAEHITDLELILAYHCCDRSSEVTKQLLELHFTLRTLFHLLFKDRLVEKTIEDACSIVLFQPLPTRAHDGCAVYYAVLIDTDTRKFVCSDAIRACLMLLDLWQFEEGTWPGLHIVIDLTGLSLGHLAKLDLHTLQQFFYYLQEALLVKLKGFHFINAPSFMDRLMLLLRPFMKKNLLEMLLIHAVGTNTLEKYVPISALPKEAGGEYLSLEEAKVAVLARLRANNQFFVQENKKRVLEAKRPGKPKTITDIFGGIEGSFKKLDID